MQGAMMLSVAGIAVKVIGALFKIPLGAILGPEGMADFSIAYNIYALLFVLSTAGVPVAVSKMIAEAIAKGKTGEVRRIFSVSMKAFALVGAIASITLFFGAEFFARQMGSISAHRAIRSISPAIFFVSIASICRGFYQGHGDMIPTAMSEVIEALCKLILGLYCAWWLSKNGFAPYVVASGAVLGVSAGALVSAIFLLLRRKGLKNEHSKTPVLRRLLSTAIPVTIGASVISLTNVIDSAIVMNLLQKIGYSAIDSMWWFGSYNYATTIFNLPGTLITTLGISLIPAIASARASGDMLSVSSSVESVFKIAMLVALPAAFGLVALGVPVMELLYGGSVEASAILASGRMLSLLAIAIPALSMSSLTSAVMQAIGEVRRPVYSMFFGAGIKILSNLILVAIPQIHIFGACISTILCYIAIAVLNLRYIIKSGGIKLSVIRIFFTTSVCGLFCGFCAKCAMQIFELFLGVKLSVILAILCGMISCVLCAYALKVLTYKEICAIFGEKRITKFLKNY